jgi:hypothetical protein
VAFREDILRGVRLFAIAFTAILLCVLAYRGLHKPVDAGAGPTPEAAQLPAESSVDPAPVAGTPTADAETPEAHPLVVPPPPPVNGRSSGVPGPPQRRANRVADIPVPGPPPLRAKRAQAPSRQEFSSPAVLSSPSTPVAESADTVAPSVGYKSLIEANANRPMPTAPVVSDSLTPEESKGKSSRGNKFLKALGKIFHRPKDEIIPLTIQQNKSQQP